ncbi:hypothetical protein F511_21625 [Dorcoceras hygrometricum]|uniref:Uncharacterized protein n=1 Tax=Dorcoceras hygrometricum TaxID=472368 RepID=A0A2Z7D0I9_9LAMI|nr:hypothetical protein F511_21625 [Dorcoceras hygrometricum]
MRDGSYPRASTSTLARSNQQEGYGYKRDLITAWNRCVYAVQQNATDNKTIYTASQTASMSTYPCQSQCCKQAYIRTSSICATITTNWVRATQISHPNKLGRNANRLHKGDVFVHLTSFKQMSESSIQMKRLSKRSPTLPLLLQSELSTVGNRRR